MTRVAAVSNPILLGLWLVPDTPAVCQASEPIKLMVKPCILLLSKSSSLPRLEMLLLRLRFTFSALGFPKFLVRPLSACFLPLLSALPLTLVMAKGASSSPSL